MPYLPLDLDAKRLLEAIERGLALPRHTMVGGAMELWEAVWRAWMGGKPPGVADMVDELALDAAFGSDPRIRAALVSREFLEPVEGLWRVCGAAKWLFGLEGKSRGGKSAAGNLKRGAQPGNQPGAPASENHRSPAKPGPKPEDTSRLDPRLLHPAPSTQHPTTLSLAGAAVAAPPVDPVRAMDALVVQAVTAGAEPDRRAEGSPMRRRRPKPERPPDPRHAPLVARLVATFLELRGAKYAFGGRDAKAVSALIPLGSDDEVDWRWRRGLHGQFRERCDTLSDLVTRWNALTGTGPPGRAVDLRKAPVRAEDVNPESFREVGSAEF